MDPNWQQPQEWSKDGSTLTAITGLKTGAWTALSTATETHNGHSAEVILKTFTIPEAASQDERKITAERDRFLVSAKLQQQLAEPPSSAWVKILKISDNPPCFTMPKYGPSLQDLLDHKVNLTARDLYNVLHSTLQALMELKTKFDRSHGDLKPSNVLASAPGQSPPFKLADPTPKGESHSANDLYNLGLILFQLIEHREYDPLTQLTPSKNWTRLGSRRDRWIQFLNLILSPNGCQDPLPDVKKEALRLRPTSPLRPVFLALTGLILISGGGVGYYLLAAKMNKPAVTTAPVATSAPAGLDPEVKAAYDNARKHYMEVRGQWSAGTRTPRYDHAKSIALAREASRIYDEVNVSEPNGYKAAVELLYKAADKWQEATAQGLLEEQAGKTADLASASDLQQAQKEYADALARWNEAAAKFPAGADHNTSKTIAEAAQLLAQPGSGAPSADPAANRLAIDNYKAAITKLTQAMAKIPEENKIIQDHAQALALFKKARDEYRQSKDKWESFQTQHKNLDLSEAAKLVDEAKKELPDQFVLTDDASYRVAAEQSYNAAQKLEQALALGSQAKPIPEPIKITPTAPDPPPIVKIAQTEPVIIKPPPVTTTQKTPDVPHVASAAEIAPVIAKADAALKSKNYPEAFNNYKKAADMGSAPAQSNVGLFYETGTGTTKDYAQAALWYKKAADQHYIPALVNLASLYQKGKGVDQNYTQALHLYKEAADLKNPDAMVSLGSLYENGQGTDQNFAQALMWYKRTADAQNPAAITNLGVFYEKGHGVPVDYKQAADWYHKAADLNYPPAMNCLAVLYDNGKYDNNKDTRPNYPEALKWYTKAAELDFAPAMCNLGALYDNGQGVPLDHAEALKWFLKAAQRNHPMAMYNLGVLYDTGRGTTADRAEALTWYRKAAHSNDPAAQRLALDALNRLGFTP